jgi:polysaccharide chain length determinant protein (PEP-CTERM system associated)
MNEIIARVTAEVRGAWRFRNIAVAFAWLIAVVGWVWVLSLPNIYESKARVFIETQSILRPLLNGLAVPTDVETNARMMSTLVLSRPNLEKVARDTDLYLRASTDAELERMVQGLSRRIMMNSARDNTYSISFSDYDPEMAQRVVQKLLNTFVENTLGVKREDTDNALRFLEQQIRESEQRLRDDEARLAEFKKQHVGLMPGEGADYFTRMTSASATLEELRTKLRTAEERQEEFERQLEGEEPTLGLGPSPGQSVSAQTGIDARIAEYRKQRETLLLQFTEKHPQVVGLNETIKDLEEQRARELAERQTAGPRNRGTPELGTNPVYQSMRIGLSRAEVEVAQLRSQVAEQERIVGQLRARMNTMPEVEAQLRQLNRDYGINLARYQELVRSLESGKMSENVDQSTEKVKFRIVEPPVVPRFANGPNRPLLLSVVLGLAIVLAGALAFFLHSLRPVFLSRASLRQIGGLPVIGSVSQFRKPGGIQGLLAKPITVAAGLALLIGAYAVALAVSTFISGPSIG